mgnify:FL=1
MSELKCPFCQQELNQYNPQSIECRNDDCKKSYFMYGSKELWQELIRTRKALDVAKDTFNWIDETYRTGQETEAEIWGNVQLAAQEITALEQKD